MPTALRVDPGDESVLVFRLGVRPAAVRGGDWIGLADDLLAALDLR